ncbi:MAG: imidazole glycerol phosphate synthase subunit HisF [Planctomycetota bacterium]
MREVIVVPTGVANLASLLAALRRAGAAPRLARPGEDLDAAARVVLPGVGTFGAASQALRDAELVRPLRARVARGAPTLAVCVGLQVLFETSEESPGAQGLGALPGPVRRFPRSVRAPQLGWNQVHAPRGAHYLEDGAAYFANTFRVEGAPAGWRAARADHGGPFVAALERAGVLACQFHPELSGEWGEALLRRWLERAAGASVHPEEAPAEAVAPGALAPRVIPCLDVAEGRVVKGVRFQGLRDAGDPVAQALAYQAQGADELVLLDVSATPEGRRTARHTVAAVREVLGIPLTVGGGVRAVEDAGGLLEAGADKVGVNTAAVADPSLLTRLADAFGAQCTVLSLDAASRQGGDGWEVVVRSGRERTGRCAVDWAREATERGAGEVLLTSWDRDGTQQGYDLPLVSAVGGAVTVPVIASGGARTPEDLAAALRAGADAVLAASIFHDGLITVTELKHALAALGVPVRPAPAPRAGAERSVPA